MDDTLEAWMPVALPTLAVFLVGLGVRGLIPRVVREGRREATYAASLGMAAFGLVAGWDAIGPPLGDPAIPWLGIGLSALGAALPWRLRHGLPPTERGFAAAALGLALTGTFALAWLATEHALAFDDPEEVGEARAQWRRRLEPHDPRALLSLAWIERRRDRLEAALELSDMAARQVEAAGEGGALEASILELQSDIHAARGECARARTLFDAALEARARDALERFDLDLENSYRMPQALVTECGWGRDAGASDRAAEPDDE